MRPFLRPAWPPRITPLSRLLRTTPHIAIHHTSTTNVASTEIPKLLVAPGSPKHHSLASYLEYANSINLRSDRSLYIGTHYEYTAAESLLRLGFSLLRTGRRNDAGIDLIGHWMLSCLREPLPVIAQCKARAVTCSPTEVRELEGAFSSIPPAWRNTDVLGLLITTQKATEGIRKHMHQSARPLGFLQVSRTGTITQFLWNRAAAERGLEGVGVTPRYTVLPLQSIHAPTQKAIVPDVHRQEEPTEEFAKQKRKQMGTPKSVESRPVVTDIQLTWLGTPVFPNREQLALETAERIATIARAHEIAQIEAQNEVHKSNVTRKRIKKSDTPLINKPRGRPPKCVTTSIQPDESINVLTTRPTKKIPRPRTLRTQPSRSTTDDTAPSIKRPRGRPPKPKSEIESIVPIVKKKRGRPPGVRTKIRPDLTFDGGGSGEIIALEPVPLPPTIKSKRERPVGSGTRIRPENSIGLRKTRVATTVLGPND